MSALILSIPMGNTCAIWTLQGQRVRDVSIQLSHGESYAANAPKSPISPRCQCWGAKTKLTVWWAEGRRPVRVAHVDLALWHGRKCQRRHVELVNECAAEVCPVIVSGLEEPLVWVQRRRAKLSV